MIFLLMATDNTFKIQVTEAFLTVRKVKVSPGVQLGHTDALMKGPAKFPITRKECKILAIPAGFQFFVKDNIFLGQLPKRLVVGMVHNEGFAGAVGITLTTLNISMLVICNYTLMVNQYYPSL